MSKIPFHLLRLLGDDELRRLSRKVPGINMFGRGKSEPLKADYGSFDIIRPKTAAPHSQTEPGGRDASAPMPSGQPGETTQPGQPARPYPDTQPGNGAQPDSPFPAAPSGFSVIDTSSGKGQGLDRCPRCGSTEIAMRAETGLLICQFCRHEWQEASLEAKYGLDSPIAQLSGTQIGSGAAAIQESAADVLTLACQACGAEVIVNTSEAMHSRCHWCRHTLSINDQLPNGAVPDGLLPFSITREQAIANIEEFVKKRRFYAHPTFVKEFAPTEVVGVFMPYLTMDANARMTVEGVGEIETRRYTVGRGEDAETRYDADAYELGRDFALHVDDLTFESSRSRADIDVERNTNNIINTILPFDTKNALTYNANYLRGFTSEKRDLNIRELDREAYGRVLSIGRARASELIGAYNRGVRWEIERLAVTGTRWVSLYLPVWLYSYYQESHDLLHYVAVNGRTGETMGSIPVRKGRLLAVSGLITLAGLMASGGLLWALYFS